MVQPHVTTTPARTPVLTAHSTLDTQQSKISAHQPPHIRSSTTHDFTTHEFTTPPQYLHCWLHCWHLGWYPLAMRLGAIARPISCILLGSSSSLRAAHVATPVHAANTLTLAFLALCACKRCRLRIICSCSMMRLCSSSASSVLPSRCKGVYPFCWFAGVLVCNTATRLPKQTTRQTSMSCKHLLLVHFRCLPLSQLGVDLVLLVGQCLELL